MNSQHRLPTLEPTETPRARPGQLLKRELDTPVGCLELVAAPTGLRAVLWPDEDGSRVQRALTWLSGTPGGADPQRVDRTAQTNAHLDAATRQLDEYFAGTRMDFELVLDPVGTHFQQRVWESLRAIPYGQTRTYAEQARALGEPAAARAVGAADGRNPLSIVVPCHRVLGTSGKLTGYAGGVVNKAWLLAHERTVVKTAG